MMRHIPSSFSRYRFPETEDFKHLFNLHPLMSLIIESLKKKVSFFFSKSEILFILSTFLFSAVRVLFETSTLSSLLYISDYEDLPMLCNFIEITLRYGCSPVNLLHIFRTLFPRNTSGWLLLNVRHIDILIICGTVFIRLYRLF